MQAMDAGFAATGMFKSGLIRDAFAAEGVRLKWDVMQSLTRHERGVYSIPKNLIVDTVAGTVESVPALVTPKKIPKAKKITVASTVEFIPQTQATSTLSYVKKVSRNNTFAEVPALDPNYVPFGNYKSIEKILKSRKFFPFYITGHSGNGKSTQIIHICAKNKIPFIKLNLTKQTDKEELIGSKTLVDGNIVIEEGPILVAMRSGAVCLLDELDAAEANNIMCLQGILEGKPFYFALAGEWITPAPGFTIVATGNTKGKGSDDGRYIGTNILNEAFLDRFPVTYAQEFPTPSIEKKIVMNWMVRDNCVDETFAEELVKWADAVRRTFRDGAIDELIATRRLEHIVGAYAICGDKREAVDLCTNRFDALTKDAFVQLFDKIATETPVANIVKPTEVVA